MNTAPQQNPITAAGSEKLRVEALSKAYGDSQVLKHISFGVQDGEFLSILGPSGCGKTTLLRILIGLLAPDTGKILKDGQDITSQPPAKRGMGIVFQNYALFENMTVLGNVEYALKYNPEHRKGARETALRLIEQVGLGEHAHKKPHRLSGGQQQRVAIARTLALSPDVILLDEPMSALDMDTRLSLREEIKRIQQAFGSTILYITHDQEEAFALSDRIMVMDRGEIQQIGTPDALIDAPQNDYVRQFVSRNIQRKIDSLIRYAR